MEVPRPLAKVVPLGKHMIKEFCLSVVGCSRREADLKTEKKQSMLCPIFFFFFISPCISCFTRSQKGFCSRWGSNSQPQHFSSVYKYCALTDYATGARMTLQCIGKLWRGKYNGWIDLYVHKNGGTLLSSANPTVGQNMIHLACNLQIPHSTVLFQ